MSDIVLDASAIIAVLKGESGAELVKISAEGASVSAVTIAEVATWLAAQGTPAKRAYDAINCFQLTVEPLNHARAIAAGFLVSKTGRRGLSLADRACLALAIELGFPALTGDRAWRDLEIGVEIRLIR